MGERREDNRWLCADMVDVEWSDANAQPRAHTVLLEDISPFGVCVQTEFELPDGALVVLNLNGTRVRAKVRYCIWRDFGFFAGLTFAPGSRWSRDRFRPQHLTDPSVLPTREPGFII